MLATPRARTNGPAFILGWIAGLALAGTIILLASNSAGAGENGQPAEWANYLKIVLGLLLLHLAFRQWKKRPHGDQGPQLPGWMKTLDHFTAGRAAALGVALSAVNPKNLLLVVAAALAIAQTGISAGEQAVALAVFVVIGTIGTATPVVIYFAMGDRSKKTLDELKAWMSHNNATIIAVILLVIAAKLIGDGISGL